MRRLPIVLVLLTGLAYACQPDDRVPPPTGDLPEEARGVVEGIDTLTGLIARGDYRLVKGNCLACHGARLITQNRATAEGWHEMIDWMQEKQGLTDLGDLEAPIVDYLATYYAPEETGRRPALDSIGWYILEME